MSDVTSTPPPPPAPQQAQQFDFVKPFAFIFEDPRWLTKVLVGGLFLLLSILLIGWFFVMGYMARLARNVVAGMQHPLPEWDDLGEYFVEGFRLFVVVLLYVLPLIVIALIFGVPGAIMGAAESEGVQNVGGCLMGTVWCLVLPLSLAFTFFVPAAMLRAVMERRLGAAFEIGEIWSFIMANIGNYLLAIVIYFVARFAAGFGIILLCIGVIFTEFWALAATTYAFAQVWRLAKR
jgi:hypothetical protein